MDEGVEQDAAEAVRWFRLAAEQEHAAAQFNLGLRYDSGEGVEQDAAEAVQWLRLAADQGLTDAQHNLGVMYANGRGVPTDHVEAYIWFSLSAPPSSGLRDETVSLRNALAEQMTTEQILEAQRRARDWTPTPQP